MIDEVNNFSDIKVITEITHRVNQLYWGLDYINSLLSEPRTQNLSSQDLEHLEEILSSQLTKVLFVQQAITRCKTIMAIRDEALKERPFEGGESNIL